jgi:hypothetical protein
MAYDEGLAERIRGALDDLAPEGIEKDADLERWMEHGLRYAASLPAKAVPARRRTRAKPRGKRR